MSIFGTLLFLRIELPRSTQEAVRLSQIGPLLRLCQPIMECTNLFLSGGDSLRVEVERVPCHSGHWFWRGSCFTVGLELSTLICSSRRMGWTIKSSREANVGREFVERI